MITATFRGQLANVCFQAATVIATSLRNNINYALPLTSGKRNQFPDYFPHLPKMQEWNGEIFNSIQYREKKFGIYEPLPNDPDLHLQGYWQSFRYFNDYRKEVIEALALPKYEMKKGYVSLHIRRGDSLNFIHKLPQPTDKYINEALDIFKCYKILVFSDDLEYCKEKFKGGQFEFCEEQDAKKAIGLMAACEHNAIVNSTFSLFASWLNDNPNKVVVSPHRESWFTEAYKDRLSAQDLIPDEYIQIRY